MQNSAPRRRLVAIGNFDGVHLGHQAVLREAASNAAARGLAPTVLTFDPHPAAVIGRGAPPLLTSLRRKVQLIQRLMPEMAVEVLTFDHALAAQNPDEFAEGILVRSLHAGLVLVGDNFRFGRARAGDFALLSTLGNRLGFETRSHAMVGDGVGTFSSTRARSSIALGDVRSAREVLGRPHALSGTVVKGDQRGRTIGFPTANIDGVVEALPAFGVYAVAVDHISESFQAHRLGVGVANIGIRPTVKVDAMPSVEVHLFNFAEDIYGANLRVHLVARLRGEQRFAGLHELRDQIALDVAAAGAVLSNLPQSSDSDFWW
ncbi:MAG: bifunctional riboflavin kinase/FAD synthetase [Polyangiaceae bacterium]|nr:bifunctional riboflavin kinase/FAD synthetase [Polyangiaceae bacterium]